MLMPIDPKRNFYFFREDDLAEMEFDAYITKAGLYTVHMCWVQHQDRDTYRMWLQSDGRWINTDFIQSIHPPAWNLGLERAELTFDQLTEQFPEIARGEFYTGPTFGE